MNGTPVAIRLYGIHGDDGMTPEQAGAIARALLQAKALVDATAD